MLKRLNSYLSTQWQMLFLALAVLLYYAITRDAASFAALAFAGPLKLTRKVPTWDGSLVAGNTMTLRLPIGLTYHQIYTEYTFSDGCCAVALADAVDQIRLVVNGKPTWSILASELDTRNQYLSRAAAAGILTLDLDRYNLRTRTGEEFTSIGTGFAGDATPVTTLAIEMDIAAGVASGTLLSRSRVSEARPLGLFLKLRRYVEAFGGSGEFEIADYPKGDLINAMYFYESANDIDRLRLERDDFVMFDRTKELNSRIQSDGVRTPQTNLFVYDTTEDGNGSDQLVTRNVNDLRWFFTLDGAMTLTTIVEYIGGLEV
jgi:hypothetical protein